MRIYSIVSKFLEFSLRKYLFLALVLLSSSVCFARVTNVEDLTLEQKVGQILIFGFKGQTLDQNLQNKIQQLKPGGLIFFKRNISSLEQLKKLNQSIQQISEIPVLTMLDQEGGNASRLPLGFTPPSSWSLGQTHIQKAAFIAGQFTGEILKDVGIHLNLAPVYDISKENSASFLGTRVFSTDVALGSQSANAFAEGLLRAHVIPTAKHFPGHGMASGDSHKILPEAYSSTELESFKKFFQVKGTKAVMMAHVAYPHLDPSGAPASLSYPIVTNLLREKLQYKDLIITDDLEMSGVEDVAPLGERVVQAFEAGCDMIMIAWSEGAQKVAYQKLLAAVRSGRISEKRLDQSVARILRAKNSWVDREPARNYPSPLEKLNKLTRIVAKLNFYQSVGLRPENLPPVKIEHVQVFASDSNFYQQFLSEWKKSTSSFYKLRPQTDLSKSTPTTKNSLFLFYASGPGSLKILKTLPVSLRKRTIVVNAYHPNSLANPKDYRAVFQMSTPYAGSATWVAKWLEQPMTHQNIVANDL